MSNIISYNEAEKDLLLNIDLRIETSERIAELSRFLIPLKESAGTKHLSVTLAYNENNRSEYTNLPAFVTENDTERILSVFFPSDLLVTIWNDNAESTIDLLEYHVDKRTQAVTETCGMRDYQYNPRQSAFNFINIDLDLMTEAEGLEAPALLASIESQLNSFTNLKRPTLFQITKNSGREISYYFLDVPSKTSVYTIDILNSNIATALNGGRLSLDYTGSEGHTTIESFVSLGGIPGRETIFLCENSTGDISISDTLMSSQLGIPGNPWTNFSTAIKEKRFPAVFLKSSDSEVFCPVNYLFTKDANGAWSGSMRISYLKGDELWTETRNFNELPDYGSLYIDLNLKKYPLLQNQITIPLAEIDTTDGLNSQAIKDAAAAQLIVSGNREIPFRLILVDTDGTRYAPEQLLATCSSDKNTTTARIRVPASLQGAVNADTVELQATFTATSVAVNFVTTPLAS